MWFPALAEGGGDASLIEGDNAISHDHVFLFL